MGIMDKISKHYQSSISGDLLKLHVEEWDSDIYYRTSYPLHIEGKISELQSQNKTVEALVESIVLKAKDAQGNRLFQDADKIKLLHEADPQVIIRVGTAINNAKVEIDQASAAKE